MISKKKVVTMFLLTALILTLTSVNLNVTSVAADPDTMTFDSNITMEFQIDNRLWVSTGNWLAFGNASGAYTYNVTSVANDTWYEGVPMMAEDMQAPVNDTWYYIYGPPELYGLCMDFHINEVIPTGPDKDNFLVDVAGDYWYRYLRDWTLEPPFDPIKAALDYPDSYGLMEAEAMFWDLMTGTPTPADVFPFGAYMNWADFIDYTNPVLDGWYVVSYPGEWAQAEFRISATSQYWLDPDANEDYWYVELGELYDRDGVSQTSMTMPPPMPIDGLDAYRLMDVFGGNQEYYIPSPSNLVPYTGSKWNITGGELAGYQFTIATTTENLTTGRNYFTIADLWDETGTPVAGDKETLSQTVLTIEAVPERTKVNQLGSWYNVISGSYPDAWTCWNVTTPGYEGTTFCIDIAGEGIFHIDEVLNAAGTPGPVSISPAEESVAAVEFIPKIYAEVSPYSEAYPGWNFNVSVSIKTDYIFHVWSYEFTLSWDPAVFECTSVTYGNLITGAGATYMPLVYDNIAGELYLAGAYFSYSTPPAPQTHGPGTLATVNFALPVNLTGVALGKYDIAFGLETRLIGVREEGNGDKYNAIDDVTGQIINPYVKVKIPGDIDGDSDVDPTDFWLFAGVYPSDPALDPQADLDFDGDIDPTDFWLFAGQYPTPYTGLY